MCGICGWFDPEGTGGRARRWTRWWLMDVTARRNITSNVMTDILFKIVFGTTDDSEPVLRVLLNAVLGLSEEDRITDLFLLAISLPRSQRRRASLPTDPHNA